MVPPKFRGGAGLPPRIRVNAKMSGRDPDTRDHGEDAPTEGRDLRERLSTLDAALKAKRTEANEPEARSGMAAGAQGMALALRLGSEFAAAVLVGAAIGWFLDGFAGSSPWGLIVFLMLGFAAGVLNILRSSALNKGAGSTGGQVRK
jgi:ATP synthase protein I